MQVPITETRGGQAMKTKDDGGQAFPINAMLAERSKQND